MARGERRVYRSRRLRAPRRRTLVVLGLLVSALAAALVWMLVQREAAEPTARETIAPFLAAWSRGDDVAAARATDRPDDAQRVLTENRKGLDGAKVQARLLSLSQRAGQARARLRVDWEIPEIGAWGYETEARLRDGPEGWRLQWAPTIVHPFVDGIARLGTTRDPAKRGKLMDRRGRALPAYKAGSPGSFARALLGTVGPVTAEQLEKAGDEVFEGDVVGQTGLQAALEREIAGKPSRRVVLRVDEVARDTLVKRDGQRSSRVRTTIDTRVQRAAEAALGGRQAPAVLVAVQPSTGDVLAVANRPSSSAFNRALEGLYPPGSTFKVVSTAALLRDGLRTGDIVDCPRGITVGGRPFRNFEGGAAGAVPFTQDFAQSCNTAFAGLSARLAPDALRRAARDYGLGERIDLPVPASRARVPVVRDPAERAASAIGQGRVLASPLAMAGVAAAVADGRWRAPRLLADAKPRAGRRLRGSEVRDLRALMRRVVTSGTGVALRDVPGEVRGKSGTAEYGTGNPPKTHAWFIAHRGDVALAVLVENGRAGGAVAAPIAARFLGALGRG